MKMKFSTAVMSDVQSNTTVPTTQSFTLMMQVFGPLCFELQQSTTSDALSYHHNGECRGAHHSQQDSKLQTCCSPECQLLLIALIQLNLCYMLLAAPQIYCQLYIQPITRSKLQLQEGFICRWWLASMPFGVDSVLPNNSFTAQRPWRWWQQLSPRYRNMEESKNTLQTRDGWAWSIYQKVRNYNLCLFYCLIVFNSMCTSKTVHNGWWQGRGLAPLVMLCNLGSAELYSSSPHVAGEIGPRRTGAYFQPRRGHCMLLLGLTPAPAIKNVFFIPANSFWSMGLVLYHSEESFLSGYTGWAPGPHADWRGATCL